MSTADGSSVCPCQFEQGHVFHRTDSCVIRPCQSCMEKMKQVNTTIKRFLCELHQHATLTLESSRYDFLQQIQIDPMLRDWDEVGALIRSYDLEMLLGEKNNLLYFIDQKTPWYIVETTNVDEDHRFWYTDKKEEFDTNTRTVRHKVAPRPFSFIFCTNAVDDPIFNNPETVCIVDPEIVNGVWRPAVKSRRSTVKLYRLLEHVLTGELAFVVLDFI